MTTEMVNPPCPRPVALSYLSLGWGVQSFTLAAMMSFNEIPRVDLLIFADTGHERQATMRFRQKWEPWLGERGLTVLTVRGKRTDVVREDWSNSVMIPAFSLADKTGDPGQVRRQCTHDWKIMRIRSVLRAELHRRRLKPIPGIVEAQMGISLDEWQRMRTSDVKYIVNTYPLVERRITRAGCIEWLIKHGLDVPPKSGCAFCPYKSLESWKDAKRENGADWAEARLVDEAIRNKRPGYQLFLHPGCRPLAAAVSIPEDYGAKQIPLEFVEEQPCDSGVCMT